MCTGSQVGTRNKPKGACNAVREVKDRSRGSGRFSPCRGMPYPAQASVCADWGFVIRTLAGLHWVNLWASVTADGEQVGTPSSTAALSQIVSQWLLRFILGAVPPCTLPCVLRTALSSRGSDLKGSFPVQCSKAPLAISSSSWKEWRE